MSDVRSYRDLMVWQRAMDVAVATYELTRTYPREELFGLTSQSRRAASSIAEASYLSFLRISRGSMKELETHLILAERVGLSASGKISPLLEQTDELGRMLHGLIARVQGQPAG